MEVPFQQVKYINIPLLVFTESIIYLNSDWLPRKTYFHHYQTRNLNITTSTTSSFSTEHFSPISLSFFFLFCTKFNTQLKCNFQKMMFSSKFTILYKKNVHN
ncbi:hypothetical protein X975_25256, partial [Stegodyphus mimosarum]